MYAVCKLVGFHIYLSCFDYNKTLKSLKEIETKPNDYKDLGEKTLTT